MLDRTLERTHPTKSNDPINQHERAQEEGSGWRFNKVRQTWVLKHLYDEGRVDRKMFKSLVLAYVGGLQQGGAREVGEQQSGMDG